MSIFLGLERITDRLVKHAGALVDRDSYGRPSVSLEVGTRAEFDAILETFPELVEGPSKQLMAGEPRVSYAGGYLDGLYFAIYTPIPTIPRACEYCDNKHDCTHVDGEVA